MASVAKYAALVKRAVLWLLALLLVLGAAYFLWFRLASHQLQASEVLVRDPVPKPRYERSVEALTFSVSFAQSVRELRLSDQSEPVWSYVQEPLTHLQLAGATSGNRSCQELRAILAKEGEKQGLGIRFDDKTRCEVEVSWTLGKTGEKNRDSRLLNGDQSLFVVLPNPLSDLPVLQDIPVAGIGAVLKSDFTVGGHPTCPGAHFDLQGGATVNALIIKAAGHGCTANEDTAAPNRPLFCLKYSGSWPLPRVNDQNCGLWTLLLTILKGSN